MSKSNAANSSQFDKEGKSSTYGRKTQTGKKKRNSNRKAGPKAPWEKPAQVDRRASSLNDVSWYTRNPELLASASNFPFAIRPKMYVDGGRLRWPEVYVKAGDSSPVSTDIVHGVPGFMRIMYAYTVGYSDGVTSPASICAKELYAQVRSKFSGSLDEDAPDLFMYVMANDQIHAFIAYLKRIYKTLNAFSGENHFFAEMALEAQFPQSVTGVYDVNECILALRTNKTEFWGYINTLVNMANKFNVPGNFDIYNRHRWMNESIYSDINAVRGQMYVFTPIGFYSVDDTSPNGTKLVFEEFVEFFENLGYDPELYFHRALYDYGRMLIAKLSDWGDAYTINGHILRAFEGTPFYTCALQAQDEVISPSYQEEVLNQIHNITIISSYNKPDVTQNPTDNSIEFKPRGVLGRSRVLIDCDGSTPTGADVTLASRLTAVGLDDGEADSQIHCGTEIVIGIDITVPAFMVNGQSWQDRRTNVWWFVPVEEFTPLDLSDWDGGGHFEDYALSVWNIFFSKLVPYIYLGAWRKAPHLLLSTGVLSSDMSLEKKVLDDSERTILTGEIDNLTAISDEDLARLHRICVYSEFNCFNR